MQLMAGPLDREFITQLGPPLLTMMEESAAAALVARYALPSDSATRREFGMPLRAFHAFTEEAAFALGNPSLGLQLAQFMPRGSYGALEFTLRSAPNVREALERLGRYSALINGLIRIEVQLKSGRGEFTHFIPSVPLVNGRVGNEFSLALSVRLVRELSGHHFTPLEVWFGHERPGAVSELESFFGTKSLHFGRGQNGFTCEPKFFDDPVVSADAALLPLVEDQARRLALSRQTTNDFPSEVREQVRKSLQSSSFGVAEVSKAMGQSQRTLQRRLSEYGTTFFDLVDSLRESLAREYVQDPKLGLGEIAYLLGYSDLSAFGRSFKRWTGKTPGDYRRSGA